MDQVTQHNAALLEEAAAASQSMQEQSASLAATVSVSKLAGRHARHAARAAARAPAAARPSKKAAVPSSLAMAQKPHLAGAGSTEHDWVEF